MPPCCGSNGPPKPELVMAVYLPSPEPEEPGRQLPPGPARALRKSRSPSDPHHGEDQLLQQTGASCAGRGLPQGPGDRGRLQADDALPPDLGLGCVVPLAAGYEGQRSVRIDEPMLAPSWAFALDPVPPSVSLPCPMGRPPAHGSCSFPSWAGRGEHCVSPGLPHRALACGTPRHVCVQITEPEMAEGALCGGPRQSGSSLPALLPVPASACRAVTGPSHLGPDRRTERPLVPSSPAGPSTPPGGLPGPSRCLPTSLEPEEPAALGTQAAWRRGPRRDLLLFRTRGHLELTLPLDPPERRPQSWS
ncbi:unnamed protein product [Rangifer tarandus platyrhynchus]|uniref:Uncharacterized protein n=1 Tax=Rangifer tarandus platyrhynchus TaxID=3082113 RepID=A0ABN8XTI4_RANTA|nr:unnamed protein product [Rangifer tarandus platyrhynchus]